VLCCAVQAPILVEQGPLRVMECALWADTSFLAGLGVMDYSLLVGALIYVAVLLASSDGNSSIGVQMLPQGLPGLVHL